MAPLYSVIVCYCFLHCLLFFIVDEENNIGLKNEI